MGIESPETGRGCPEKERREKGEGRREKGEGRREKGEGRREKTLLPRRPSPNPSVAVKGCSVIKIPDQGEVTGGRGGR